MRLDSRAGAVALLALAACASGPKASQQAPLSPQAYLEQELIGPERTPLNAKTADGGMLYHADFNAANPRTLRLPFDLLKRHCEDRAGRWVPSGRVRVTAASLATAKAPRDISTTLAEADARGLFGKFRCELGSSVWTATIEPSAFSPTDTSQDFRLQVFVKAYEGTELSTGGEQSLAPGTTAPAGAASPTPPVAADSIRLPPGTQPVVTQQSSPLNPQPLVPPAQSDKLLADPKPFGLSLGSDSPEVFATKLRIGPGGTCIPPAPPPPPVTKPGKQAKSAPPPPSPAPPPRPGVVELCWQPPDASEASSLHATFADLGMDPVLAEFEVQYPPASFSWLEHAFRNAWGPSDNAGNTPGEHVWSWLHTTISLTHLDGDPTHDTIVQAHHKPTLDRMQLPIGSPGREQPGAVRIATPWQLQLGYEPAELAQAKLQAVGLAIARGSCVDGGLHARPVLTRSCRLQGGRMDGLREASVEIVDPGDGRPRLAQLSYSFDKRVLDETVRELRTQYGDPISGAAGLMQWWTGPIGIEIQPTADTFSLRYFHGRMLQIAHNAHEKNRVGDKALQHQGL